MVTYCEAIETKYLRVPLACESEACPLLMSIKIILDWWLSSQTTDRQADLGLRGFTKQIQCSFLNSSSFSSHFSRKFLTVFLHTGPAAACRVLCCAGPMSAADPTSLEGHQSFVSGVAQSPVITDCGNVCQRTLSYLVRRTEHSCPRIGKA